MKTKTSSLVAVLFLSAFSLFGATQVYFGEDVSPYPPVPTGPNFVPRPVFTNSERVAAQFVARLAGVRTESFEGYASGSSPTNLAFGTTTATLSGTREVWTLLNPTNTEGGVFPITGTNSLVLWSPGNSVSFTVSFNSPQAAFGFYGEDVEFNRFAVRLTHHDGGTSVLPINVTVPQGSGGVFYLGIIDKERPFVTVEFQNLGANEEGFGFDDLTIATPEQVVPPPLSIRVSQVELCWDTATNEIYQLQYRSSLTTNVWLPFGGPVVGNAKTWVTSEHSTIELHGRG